MAYEFERSPSAKFKFHTNQDSSFTTTLAGINATLGSAATICDGVASLMAIGNNNPAFSEGERTVTDLVYYDD